MTIRPRAAKSLRDLRTRLRDLAAASHAGALAARDRSRDALHSEQEALEQHFDAAQHELAGATSIYDLQMVDEDTGVHRLAIADANKALLDETKKTQLSEAALRERSRQLKSSEALVERIETALSRKVAVAEQRAYDDISASPRRR
jgi:flagellar biosynthesis chaperone FliJ